MPKSFLYIFRTYSRTFKDRGDNPVDITSEYLFNFESFDDTKIGTTNEGGWHNPKDANEREMILIVYSK